MSPSPDRWTRPLLITLAAALVAAPALAYTVYLKDGSEVVAKERFRVEGDRAILTLPSGTQTFLALSEIDLERTEEMNRNSLGTARVLEGVGDAEEIDKPPPPPERETLSDLVGRRRVGLSLPEIQRREGPEVQEEGTLPRTSAGFVDFMAWGRRPYDNEDVTVELQRFLKGQGLERVRVYQGTRSDRVFLEIVTNSEASVFKALGDCSNALVQIQRGHASDVEALELLMVTDGRVRAGQFVLTPELAGLLVTGEMSAPRFFLDHVQF